jgi:hypothetical protein
MNSSSLEKLVEGAALNCAVGERLTRSTPLLLSTTALLSGGLKAMQSRPSTYTSPESLSTLTDRGAQRFSTSENFSSVKEGICFAAVAAARAVVVPAHVWSYHLFNG